MNPLTWEMARALGQRLKQLESNAFSTFSLTSLEKKKAYPWTVAAEHCKTFINQLQNVHNNSVSSTLVNFCTANADKSFRTLNVASIFNNKPGFDEGCVSVWSQQHDDPPELLVRIVLFLHDPDALLPPRSKLDWKKQLSKQRCGVCDTMQERLFLEMKMPAFLQWSTWPWTHVSIVQPIQEQFPHHVGALVQGDALVAEVDGGGSGSGSGSSLWSMLVVFLHGKNATTMRLLRLW